MDTLFLPAILFAIPLGALTLILHQRFRRPGGFLGNKSVRLVGRITGPGKKGSRACGLGDTSASRFTLRTPQETFTVLSQGAVLRPGFLRRKPELRVGDLVTLDATPATRQRQRGAYREQAHEQVLDAVRVVRGSWARARWAALPLVITASAVVVGGVNQYKNTTKWSRAAASLRCPVGTEVMSAPAHKDSWAMWCQTAQGKRHGAWGLFHESGNPRVVGQYDKGKVVGTWTEYYPNGYLKAKGPLEDPWWTGRTANFFWEAVKEGKWKFFYPEGGKWVTGRYWAGKRHDEWKEFDTEGYVLWRGRYTRKGALRHALSYKLAPDYDVPTGDLGRYAPPVGLGRMTAPGNHAVGAPSLMWGNPRLSPSDAFASHQPSLR